jgi:SAM-dependent methyltransferase
VRVEYFNQIREEEMRRVLSFCSENFRGKDILELGSGTGVQLKMLEHIAKSMVGLELAGSQYLRHKVCDIREYDGKNIPFENASYDVVFSSNVIEHVKDERQIHGEIRRVLRSGGKAIHVVPSRMWRIVTSIIHYPAVPIRKFQSIGNPHESSSGNLTTMQDGTSWKRKLKRLIPEQHGELGGWFEEYRDFGANAWRARFRRLGWEVEAMRPLGLLYSGNCLLADRLGIESRTQLSKLLGSSTILFVLRTS